MSGAADHAIQFHDTVSAKTVSVFPNHMRRIKQVEVAQGCFKTQFLDFFGGKSRFLG